MIKIFFRLDATWLNRFVVRAALLFCQLQPRCSLLESAGAQRKLALDSLAQGLVSCTRHLETENKVSSLPESAFWMILQSSTTNQQQSNKKRYHLKIASVGSLVMGPPKARMTNDRSTGVAWWENVAIIWHEWMTVSWQAHWLVANNANTSRTIYLTKTTTKWNTQFHHKNHTKQQKNEKLRHYHKNTHIVIRANGTVTSKTQKDKQSLILLNA